MALSKKDTAAVKAAAKAGGLSSSQANAVVKQANSGGSSSSSSSISTPAPVVAPLIIDSGLSAKDQAAVKQAYIQGGGSEGGVSYSAPAPVAPTPTPIAPAAQTNETLKVITDPLTGEKFARDTSDPTSTFKPYTGTETPATPVPVTQNQAPQPVAPQVSQPTQVPAQIQEPGISSASSQATQAAATPQNSYTGTSVVDYLNSIGQASDFSSRSILAAQYGMQEYTGTAAQNTALLNTLRTNQGLITGNAPVSTPTGQVGASGVLGKESAVQASVDEATRTSSDKYAGLDPVSKQVQMYTDAYKALGLSTIKEQYEKYAKEEMQLQNELSEKMQNNQNNPWLSQGLVDKMNEQLKTKYAVRLDTLSNLLNLTDSLYKQGLAQVDHLVSDANTDIKATNDLAQKQIDAANALARDNQVVTIGNNEVLVNKQTGKQIAVLGPTAASVKPTSTGSSTAKTAAASMDSDIQSAVSQLQQIVKAKNFRGISPDDYQVMADYLQKTYGTKAVAALKTALNAVGLKVDTGKNTDGTPIKY